METTQIEQFKPFPLAPGVMVGNFGTIIRPNGRKASNKPDNIGYLKISIVIGGVLIPFKQHRVVAITWVPNPDNLPEVNHLDGIKTNNAANNLEWSTHADNIRHGKALGLWTKPGGRAKGYKASAETKAKQSAAKKGKFRLGSGGKWITKRAPDDTTGPIKSDKLRQSIWTKVHGKLVKSGQLPH